VFASAIATGASSFWHDDGRAANHDLLFVTVSTALRQDRAAAFDRPDAFGDACWSPYPTFLESGRRAPLRSPRPQPGCWRSRPVDGDGLPALKLADSGADFARCGGREMMFSFYFGVYRAPCWARWSRWLPGMAAPPFLAGLCARAGLFGPSRRSRDLADRPHRRTRPATATG